MTSWVEGLGIDNYSRSTGEDARRHTPSCSYVHPSQTRRTSYAKLRGMTSQNLARALDEFLSASSGAMVREDGAVLFDLAEAKYSISGESNKCLIHFWSEERNLVRRVLDIETKGETLRVTVQKMGQTKPVRLEICRERDPRSMSAKKSARAQYQRILERVLKKKFPDLSLVKLSRSMDLENSFGPIYARGLMKRGQSAFAVFGVNSHELQGSIDAALTFGILWLHSCRTENAGRLVVEGLMLFAPPGSSALLRDRIAHLNPETAKWRLYELDERSDELNQIEISDRGNVKTRLVRCADDEEVFSRFGGPIALVRSTMSNAEIGVLSPTEISFRCHGLEFARARMSAQPGKFHSTPELAFGAGPAQRLLDDRNLEDFERLVRSIGEVRHAEGPHECRWWRLHPERWLESLVIKDICALDDNLDPRWRYSQVPAFSAADRAMIDVLTVMRDGRLAILELKANEDIHLPLQGIDYWARVAWHHREGEFQKFGYFAGRELSPEPPLLMMVAPALHVHPATDTLLRYIHPEIEWVLLGIDERWRKDLRVVFRKRPQTLQFRTAV
jgi:hypothetical protein